MGDAFTSAEEAADAVFECADSFESNNVSDYLMTAAVRIKTDLTALRAENARLREQLDGRDRAAELACENPPTGCECPGCSQARDEAARAALDSETKGTKA